MWYCALEQGQAAPFPALPCPRCSLSWAGVFWVLLSEIFSMGAKSPATAAATAMLFLTGKAKPEAPVCSCCLHVHASLPCMCRCCGSAAFAPVTPGGAMLHLHLQLMLVQHAAATASELQEHYRQSSRSDACHAVPAVQVPWRTRSSSRCTA